MKEATQKSPSPRASSLPLMLGVRKWRSSALPPSASVLDPSAKKIVATSPGLAGDELEYVQKLAERDENVAEDIKSDAGANSPCRDSALAEQGGETKGKRTRKRKPRMKKDLEWLLDKSMIGRAEKKGIIFIKMRGFPLWPAQKIPERKTRSDNVPKRPSGTSLRDDLHSLWLPPLLRLDLCTLMCFWVWCVRRKVQSLPVFWHARLGLDQGRRIRD